MPGVKLLWLQGRKEGRKSSSALGENKYKLTCSLCDVNSFFRKVFATFPVASFIHFFTMSTLDEDVRQVGRCVGEETLSVC